MPKPTLDYEPPRPVEASTTWAMWAFFATLAVFPAAAFGGAVLGEMLVDDPYAGIGGLFYGIVAASAFQFVVLAVGIMLLRRRTDPRKRGVGHGMVLAAGFSLVASGLCFGMLTFG